MSKPKKIVMSLYDRTAVMVKPWAQAGWTCLCVDIQHPLGFTKKAKNIWTLGADILTWNFADSMQKQNWQPAIVFSFSPCTHIAVSGARWFKEKGLGKLIEGLSMFHRGMQIAEELNVPYMLENPTGVISSFWRKPDYTFNPHNFALDIPDEAYSKKTSLWCSDDFVMPDKDKWNVPPVLGSKMHLLPPSADRADLRSVTPNGFAKAVYEANHEALLCR